MRQISARELHGLQNSGQPVTLIDVRSAGEFAAGHVPGAVNIPLEQIESRMDDLGSRPLVMICQGGTRAAIACQQLAARRSDLHLLSGGTNAWISEGYPAVRSTANRWALERQVRLGAGLLVLIGTGLGLFVAQPWTYLAMFVGAGLTFAGATNICGMAMLLAKMPWNRPNSGPRRPSARG